MSGRPVARDLCGVQVEHELATTAACRAVQRDDAVDVLAGVAGQHHARGLSEQLDAEPLDFLLRQRRRRRIFRPDARALEQQHVDVLRWICDEALKDLRLPASRADVA